MKKRGQSARRRPLTQAVAMCLPVGLSLSAHDAHALTQQQPATTISVAGSTSLQITPPASNDQSNLTGNAVKFSKFDSKFGVLTGVDHRIVTTSASGTATIDSGFKFAPNQIASGAAVVGIDFPPFRSEFGGEIAVCDVSTPCPASTKLSVLSSLDVAVVADPDLDTYVGETGTILVTPRILRVLDVTPNSGISATAQIDAKWQGTVDTTYTYLKHAAPVFGNQLSSLTLDFGTVKQGDAGLKLKWGIRNSDKFNADIVSLDLDSISSKSSDAARFNTGFSGPFTGLLSGSLLGFSATFDTSQPGSFLAIYLLSLSDADVGAPLSRHSYTLSLNLTGTVLGTVVPLPTTWTFLLPCLGAIVWSSRKRSALPTE